MALLVLRDYPQAGTNDAALISVPLTLQGRVEVYDATPTDVTAYLIQESILIYRFKEHGWVANADAATNWNVQGVYYAMSAQFNAGETPVFFARVVNSLTNEPLKSADVDSIALTIYSYSANNIRSSTGTGYTPIDDWKDVPMTVQDVIIDNPAADPRVSFVPNLVFEPDTLTVNPFENAGQYRAVFTITPVSGNRIPVIIDFKTR